MCPVGMLLTPASEQADIIYGTKDVETHTAPTTQCSNVLQGFPVALNVLQVKHALSFICIELQLHLTIKLVYISLNSVTNLACL